MLLQSDGDASLLSRTNYVANLQVLVAELEASKDLNHKVIFDETTQGRSIKFIFVLN